ncbi:LacI family DNA-binding transcriptional regulator [Sphingomonas nostoxanthinifaciens]|uniref:LacI family DNA-binding transcriptional regulator n=1 Tax=Sphingomonas nostoxanthinifaciens TaxID=2872652 RepID=UPI001CC1D4C1|nr:LacI family DNA-binding transcriptional regulator [Sphingomonas nostoxanthinifaciens]UAK23150.1 LacI family DNA-binding transcriptional regulator [Sphingomonas nostoxanthinifaciens]
MTDPRSDAPKGEARVRNIAELAKLAGVNAGTVSRALADSPVVALKTRQRIQALAAKHNYRPNQMAQRLRTQRTGVIGVVVPLGHEQRQHLSDPFFMSLLGHLADTLTENGYDIMLSRVIPNADDWLERIVESGMLDGVLLIGQSDQHGAIERVARTYRPLVAWGIHQAGQVHCAIGSDNFEGGRLAGARLIAGGARRIAFLGETRAPEFRLRFEGVAAAMAEAGLPRGPLPLHVHIASDDMEHEIAAQIDRAGAEIDGIATASDVIAMRTLRVLADRAIDVPGRIRVIGFDDLPLAIQTVPRLTTIRQDLARGSEAMVSALFARIAGDDTPSLQMEPQLMERDTA